MQTEHFFTCPHCWEQISFILDVSVENQTYVEDCEVCCNPILVRVEARDEELVDFRALRAQD